MRAGVPYGVTGNSAIGGGSGGEALSKNQLRRLIAEEGLAYQAMLQFAMMRLNGWISDDFAHINVMPSGPQWLINGPRSWLYTSMGSAPENHLNWNFKDNWDYPIFPYRNTQWDYYSDLSVYFDYDQRKLPAILPTGFSTPSGHTEIIELRHEHLIGSAGSLDGNVIEINLRAFSEALDLDPYMKTLTTLGLFDKNLLYFQVNIASELLVDKIANWTYGGVIVNLWQQSTYPYNYVPFHTTSNTFRYYDPGAFRTAVGGETAYQACSFPDNKLQGVEFLHASSHFTTRRFPLHEILLLHQAILPLGTATVAPAQPTVQVAFKSGKTTARVIVGYDGKASL